MRSMEEGLPVRGNVALRAWCGLRRRVRARGGERGAVDVVLGAVTKEPVLARFETGDDRMAGGVVVLGRVLRRGGVAAADVSAFGASAEVEPPPSRGQTLDASGSTRWNAGINTGGL